MRPFVLLTVAVLLLAACGDPPPPAPADPILAKPKTERGSPPKSAMTAGENTEEISYAALLGTWQRPDGGYLLKVKSVATNGNAAVTYRNPKPIKVAEAKASTKEGQVGLYVELQDEGYPGCKYFLTYDPERDILVGEYFQAAMRQTFPVGFARVGAR